MKLLLKCQFLYYFVIVVHATRRKGQLVDSSEQNNWNGKWFPGNPFEKKTQQPNSIDSKECDDGVHDIEIDFSVSNKQQSFNYLCISSNLTAFQPNVQTQTLLTEYYIPPAYKPYSICNKTPINYEQPIPTFGTFRLLSPKYGEYNYLPAQRWLRSVAEGAIVMLYHPCAEHKEVNNLKKLVNACLYRHIITPSIHLSSEYPLALVAWGKLLKLSVVDTHLVVDFIKKNAKQGPFSASIGKELQTQRYYEHYFLNEARLVTDMQDSELCAFDI